jgi:hypothetical protein
MRCNIRRLTYIAEVPKGYRGPTPENGKNERNLQGSDVIDGTASGRRGGSYGQIACLLHCIIPVRCDDILTPGDG